MLPASDVQAYRSTDLLNVDSDDVTEQFFVEVERQAGVQLFDADDLYVVTVDLFLRRQPQNASDSQATVSRLHRVAARQHRHQ